MLHVILKVCLFISSRHKHLTTMLVISKSHCSATLGRRGLNMCKEMCVRLISRPSIVLVLISDIIKLNVKFSPD